MKRNKFFTRFYGIFEVLVDVSSGGFMLLGTAFFMHQYLPGISFPDDPQYAAAQFMVRSFGLMTFMSGLMQFAAIQFGDKRTRTWFLYALIVGDALQILVSALYVSAYGEWTALHIFNMIFTPSLILSRIYFLITGVPGRE